MILEVYCYLP
ncbi:hypothetical protein LINPERPRIM_LOCUS22442 [Linum perenne]